MARPRYRPWRTSVRGRWAVLVGLLFGLLVGPLGPAAWSGLASAAVPVYGYDIVHTYPHDTSAFTEGLFYLNGYLYESTGLEQHSSIRKVRLETGEVVQKLDIPAQYFG